MKKIVLIAAVVITVFACTSEPSVSAEETEMQDMQDKEEADDAFKDLEEGNDSMLMQAAEEPIEETTPETK